MGEDQTKPIDPLQALERRLEMLERENEQLRAQLEPLTGKYNPCFHPKEFQRIYRRTILPVILAISLLPAIVIPLVVILHFPIPNMRVGPLPLVDLGGSGSGIPGMGLGIIAVGGASLGVIAIGGMAVGIVAIGGGAVGIIAFGGGSVGLIAIGGGACGYIALGGSAVGRFAFGQRAYGTYALGLNRQDQEAIEFFRRYIPGLGAAVTTAMQVIPLPRQSNADG